MKQVTLTVISYDNKILLGKKKRGFGEGKWNGFGGKPEINENLLDCVIRETQEETGIILQELELVGIIDFDFVDKPEWTQQVHIYKTSKFDGTPIETEEMFPQEFELEKIPYDSMWADDKYWLPQVLTGSKVKGSFTFKKDGSIAKQEVNFVNEL